MKITYLRLENVAGLVIGSNKDILEIDFSKSRNKIIAIIARNASGKSVLLSSLSPFAGVTSIDERSTLSYIVPEKNGYKEIHYIDDENEYIIKHYYKASSKTSHTIKSYFTMNGVELNENGNVRSFLSLIEIHMGLTPDMMRLIRLGSNLNSILSLSPASRKDYIGNLIDEIDIYMRIHKFLNEKIKTVKAMMSSNSINLYNCHITDLVVEEEKLSQLSRSIKEYEKEKDKIIAKLATIKTMISSNDIDDLKRKKKEAEVSLDEFARIEALVLENKLTGVSIENLATKRSNLLSSKIDTQSKINSYRISIDNALRSIERLEISIKKVTSNNDVQSLTSMIESLQRSVDSTNKTISSFKPPEGITSDIIYQIIGTLSSFNVISQNIHTFGNKPTEVYLRLRRERINIDKWLKEQAKRNVSKIKDGDLQILYDKIFKDEFVITPNCDTEYKECPYFRLSEVIDSLKNKAEEESYDSETLRYIQVISNNIDSMMNEIDRIMQLHLPDSLKENLRERNILTRLGDKLPFFDLSWFHRYLTILREYEIYQHDLEKLKDYQYQLFVYKKSGIDGQLDEIKELKESIGFYNNNINTLTDQVNTINLQLSEIDDQITIVSKFNDSKKYKKMFETTLETTNKILVPLENAEHEKMELEFTLTQTTNLVNASREQHKQLESRINEYRRLLKEGQELSETFNHLNIILKSASTKKGIPVKYIKRYLGKIKNLANNLLSIIYGGAFRLADFYVDEDTFEIPYIRNGRKVSDVKYSSQSEFAISAIALSFALMNRASGRYNIPLLDEVDSGLDEDSRPAFLKMIYTQMQALHAEQSFIISQNLSQMINVPMDCIILSDVGGVRSKLQNVIYE